MLVIGFIVGEGHSVSSAAPSSGWQIVYGTTTVGSSTQPQSIVVNCPSGHVLGGGGGVYYPLKGVAGGVPDPNGILIWSQPLGRFAWEAVGVDRTKGHSWAVGAYVICATI